MVGDSSDNSSLDDHSRRHCGTSYQSLQEIQEIKRSKEEKEQCPNGLKLNIK